MTRLTFPSSEKLGSILDDICTPVLDHRIQEAEGRACICSVRIAKAGIRHREFMTSRMGCAPQLVKRLSSLVHPSRLMHNIYYPYSVTQTQMLPNLIYTN